MSPEQPRDSKLGAIVLIVLATAHFVRRPGEAAGVVVAVARDVLGKGTE